MAYSQLINVTSDLGSGFDRVRVDPGQTGFFEGREFRSYFEFSTEAGTALAVGATRDFKFISPVDFILQSQVIELDAGGVRIQAFINATDGGGWSTVQIVAKNRSPTRRVFPSGYYVGQATFLLAAHFPEVRKWMC